MANGSDAGLLGGMLVHLPVIVQTMDERKFEPPHWHDYTQIWYVLKGSFRHIFDDVEHIQCEGECAVILPYTPHSLDTRESSDDTCIISIRFLDKFLTEHGCNIFSYSKLHARFEGFAIPSYVQLSSTRKAIADSIALAMISEFSRHKQMSYNKLAELLSSFLKNLCSEPAKAVHGLDTIIEHSTDITETIRYMANNLSKKLSLDFICGRVCMSRCAFTKHFKAVTGMTSNEFILSARLLHSTTLLVFTDKTLSTISKEVGFYDSAHFSHAFQNKFGKTPKQYRDDCRPASLENDAKFRDRWAWFFE